MRIHSNQVMNARGRDATRSRIQRVAVIFDNTIRPETTGLYCRRALGGLVRDEVLTEVEHFGPRNLERVPPGRFDLFLFVDDGLVTSIPDHLRPAAWWAIDTHLGFERCLAVARQADGVFCAQQNGAAQLQSAGIDDALWLPLACDPDLHGGIPIPKRWDVAFVGHVFPGERQRLLELVQARYPNTFVGNRYFEQMAETYAAARCVFNRSIANDLNMRVFEGLCSGSLVITNALDDNGQSELFGDGRHLVTYGSDHELLDKLAYYLEHDAERERIAAAGRAAVLARHTYRHRMETLLTAVQSHQSAPVTACRNGRACCRNTDKPCRKSRHSRNRLDDRKRCGLKGRCIVAPPTNGTVPPLRSAVAAKEPLYFEFDRPDVLELVPRTARRILDIGCGGGRLGAALKERQPCEVVGIELNPRAAAHARERLDEVVSRNIESDELAFDEGRFDCVICADVLEHLREPEAVLRRIRRWLMPDGSLVTSIPNVRHHSVIQSLLAGNWTYESAGLLDADHVRFFTRREIEKLLFRSGFEVDDLQMVPGEGYDEWVRHGRSTEVAIGGLQIRATSEADAQEFFAYQWLARSVPMRTEVDELARVAGVPPTATFDELGRRFPWPAERPQVEVAPQHAGWFADGARAVLAESVTPDMRLIVELGSWLGLSTRFLAERAPQARIIAIDHWQGSPEHHRDPELRKFLPKLYGAFQAASWEYRDRIQPLRLTTQEGLQSVADAGLQPDLIFVDADHTYAAVRSDLETCRRLFPRAMLTGDDFDDPNVQRAVKETAQAESLTLRTYGQSWRGWRLEMPHAAVGRSSRRAPGLTSIIIATHNQLPYTQACLDSIRLRTDEPHELIVVDNGSTDGTVAYLQSLDDVRLIVNDTNRGFPAAVNQGMALASGAQVLLLNNDTIVTTGWLRRMLDVLHSDRRIGLVGPVSNNVSGEQQVVIGYSQLAELDGWAWDRQRQFAPAGLQAERAAFDTDRLVGFCLLIKQEIIDRIGVLDERFGIGCFEDDDYCRRAINAGYRAVIAPAAFVHHFGSATFRASGDDLGDVLQRNQQIYEQKWGATGSGCRGDEQGSDELPSEFDSRASAPDADAGPSSRPRYVVAQHPDGGLVLQPNIIRLSVCLIVRDNEHTIRPCLESIRPWVDEIVVVDTGSTDRTPEICEELGARVFHWSWRDDFAAARNISLEHARGDWLLWMDSDDTIPAECGQKLRALADGPHREDVLGYVLQVHCPGDDPSDVTVVDHVKLVRNRPDIRFEFRIHEQVLPAIRRAGGEVEFTDIYVVHSGSDHTKDGQARKLERDFRLLELELADRQEHPFVLFNLGMTCADCGRNAVAIDYLERCIAVSQPEESHVRKAYALLVSVLSRDGQTTVAIESCELGLRLYPDDKELLFRRAMLHHEQGELAAATATYRRVLEEVTDRHFTSVDTGVGGFKARHNLALVYEDQGDNELAAAEWSRILKDEPTYVPAWRGRAEALLRLGQTSEVLQLRAELAARSDMRLRHLISYINGRLSESMGDIESALAALGEADRLEPTETTALRQTCRLLFEAGRWERARESLAQLAARVPDDASVRHNLGLAHWHTGDHSAARREWTRSLTLRPGHRETQSLIQQSN